MNFSVLDQFDIDIIKEQNSFEKIRVDASNLIALLFFLRDNEKLSFPRLNCIIGVDLGIEQNKFELIYDLYSVASPIPIRVSVLLDRTSPHVPSVEAIYKSAYFDECEIYDMFGITFDNNHDLKRLLMPKGWIGYPLRKDYELSDERLAWND